MVVKSYKNNRVGPCKMVPYGMLLCIVTMLSCGEMNSPERILVEVQQKIANTSAIRYSYHSETNNLFNETHYADSAEVGYYKLEESHHGFGLHVISKKDKYSYDGFELSKLEHDNKRIVQYDPQEIESDPDYFSRFTFFANNPMMIINYHDFAAIRDTMINGQKCFVYKDEVQRKSNSDTTVMVRYQKWFFVEKESKDIVQIADITIRDSDTLQVLDCFFNDYSYRDEGIPFPKMDPKNEVEYDRVSELDAEEEFAYVPIKEGEKLSKSSYIDVDGREISLFGEDEKSCLIMFSFIGCAPCETALKDFKAAHYDFSKEINFYYSSFQNDSSALKRYLEKKEFPNSGFGKESHMIDEFSLYHAPSFVLIDSSGTIIKVIEGYDEEVKATLLELLSPQRN